MGLTAFHTVRALGGQAANRSFSKPYPSLPFFSEHSQTLPLTLPSSVSTGENRLSCPMQPCRTRNDMKIPTWGAIGGSILGRTQGNMNPSSSTMAPSFRRLLPPKPEKSVPGTLPLCPACPLCRWARANSEAKLLPSSGGGSQTHEEREIKVYILTVS